MKTIYKIAQTELRNLFYSPVAWFILIIFTFQVSLSFSEVLGYLVYIKSLGASWNLTDQFFAGSNGIFGTVQGYLYLYIPLLTMGLMSRDLGSGSINLLYSSPVTNAQIILGKFLSMMFFGGVLIGILLIYCIYVFFSIENADIPLILSGLLGLYLLICAYSAIGLFMSSQTSYQVVAAIGTLAILAVLNYVRGMWQDVEFVRDITYWLAMSGRSAKFVWGLICSEDVLYFVIVVAMFLGLTILRLRSLRQKSPWMVTWGKYFTVVAVAMLLGYVSSRPQLMAYYDATRTKVNTLTKNSQDIVAKLKGGLTITTYTNLFDSRAWIAMPTAVKGDLKRFEQYTRFKPEIKMKYVYYYDTTNNPAPKRFAGLSLEEQARKMAEINKVNFRLFLSPEEIRKQIDLSGEGYHFVRLLERENGEKMFLRVFDDLDVLPKEQEISAAFKRMVMKLPIVGFVGGHGVRDYRKIGERDYNLFAGAKTFRYALVNQGFDITDVSLEKEVPEEVNILVIADMRTPLTAEEQMYLDQYIARGGNLVVAGEPTRQEAMNPVVERFGVKFMPGLLVRPTENYAADLICSRVTREASGMSYSFGTMVENQYVIAMPGCAGLEYTTDKGFQVTPWFVTDSLAWNELETTDFINDTVRINPKLGEVQQSYVTGLALTREVAGREQKIVVLGDADCISNGEFTRQRKGIRAGNFSVITGSFFWLSDGEVPVDVRRPASTDNTLYTTQESLSVTKVMLNGVLPGLLLLLALFIWIRRRGR